MKQENACRVRGKSGRSFGLEPDCRVKSRSWRTDKSVGKRTWRQPHHDKNLQYVSNYVTNSSYSVLQRAAFYQSLSFFFFSEGLELFSVSSCIPLTHFVRLWGHTQASFLPGKTIRRIQNQWGHANTSAICTKNSRPAHSENAHNHTFNSTLSLLISSNNNKCSL